MPGQQVRGGNPAAAAGPRQPGQPNIRGGMNARPITGQSATGQPTRMPVTGQPVPGRAPVAPPAGVPNPVNRYKFTQQMRNPPQAGVQPNMVMSQVIHIFERNLAHKMFEKQNKNTKLYTVD